ncbi:MAG: SLC13 family permease, partial [Acidimicrobiales bacterium]
MAVAAVGLLLAGVGGAILRPWRAPAWLVPLVAAVAVVAIGGLSSAHAGRALDPLRQPIGFLLAAVPLAVMLDRLGFFASLAARLTSGRGGVGGLWLLAALVTTVLNLDASVVLLTPLYVRIARRTGRDPLTLALMPVL